MFQELGQRHALLDRARIHRGRLDHFGLERLGQPAPDADQSGRRKHDEPDEQQTEEQQPVRSPDRQILAEQDEKQRAKRGTEQTAHAADDHHGEQLARERNRRRVGRRETMMEREQHTSAAGQHRRHRVSDLFVAVGCITDELRALLVFADRDEYGADRRAMKALERVNNAQAQRGHQCVIDPGLLEVEAEPVRARHPAQSTLAAGERRPAKGNRVGERREREGQQREVDPAPPQHEETNRHGGDQQDDQ